MLGLEGSQPLISTAYWVQKTTTNGFYTVKNRSINRHRWQLSQLQEVLSDPESTSYFVYKGLRTTAVTKTTKAFHPNADQYPLHLGSHLFGFIRESLDREQQIMYLQRYRLASRVIVMRT